MLKQILLALFIISPLSACDYSREGALSSVKSSFPNGTINKVPGQNYSFIVQDKDGFIWYVETHSLLNDDMTNQVRLFQKNKL